MKYKPHFSMSIERERFIIKTAENEAELKCALMLRHDVFYKELMGKTKLSGLDKDKFDYKCDHLIIIEKKSGMVIGTYRMISSLFSKNFYSATEFNIKPLLKLPGEKLEIGRACVHKDYRTGSTIALLWRGISEYMKLTNTQYLFGCSSIMTTDKKEIAGISKYFMDDPRNLILTVAINPRLKYRVKYLKDIADADVSSLIPPLVKSYMKMGAVVCCNPAMDRKFRCVDYLTLFSTVASSEKTKKRYDLHQTQHSSDGNVAS